MNATTEVSNMDDLIDVRDIIARIEELQSDLDDLPQDANADDAREQREKLQGLTALLGDLEGMGGDEQYKGIWYPVTLIRDSYFREYAEQLADDIGAINAEASWPNDCIDWERAARELRIDYSSVEFDGVTYWTR